MNINIIKYNDFNNKNQIDIITYNENLSILDLKKKYFNLKDSNYVFIIHDGNILNDSIILKDIYSKLYKKNYLIIINIDNLESQFDLDKFENNHENNSSATLLMQFLNNIYNLSSNEIISNRYNNEEINQENIDNYQELHNSQINTISNNQELNEENISNNQINLFINNNEESHSNDNIFQSEQGKSNLQILENLGFNNKLLNKEALFIFGNDIDGAITYIINNQD